VCCGCTSTALGHWCLQVCSFCFLLGERIEPSSSKGLFTCLFCSKLLVGAFVTVLAVRFAHRSSKDVVEFFQFKLGSSCLDACSVVHTIFFSIWFWIPRWICSIVLLECIFLFSIWILLPNFCLVVFITTLCKLIVVVFPFWIVFTLLRGCWSDLCPPAFYTLFYLLYFPLLKKNLKILFSQFQNIK
jgi:hypothetical protein